MVGERKVVVCNADEGETTTFKDRELIKNDPFNLIEALIIAGYVVGATDGYIYMRAEYACYRPLLFATADPEVAAARGVPVRALGIVFAALVGVAAAQ